MWASRWKHSPRGREWDLRYHQEVLHESPRFIPAEPDDQVAKKLVALVSSCGLTHAAPEILETRDGRMVLIDMNPCGDWIGFFGRRAESEIAQVLADSIRMSAG